MPVLPFSQSQLHFWKNGGIECNVCMRVGGDYAEDEQLKKRVRIPFPF